MKENHKCMNIEIHTTEIYATEINTTEIHTIEIHTIEIHTTVSTADTEAWYDKRVKHLFSNRIIQEHILIKTVNKFQGIASGMLCNIIEVIPWNLSAVSIVPVEAELTDAAEDKNGQRNNNNEITIAVKQWTRFKKGSLLFFKEGEESIAMSLTLM